MTLESLEAQSATEVSLDVAVRSRKHHRTKAMATGTMGHRMLTQLEIKLLLLKEIFRNFKG